ncbi:hypothetical protein B0H11DRAFT_2225654 [Mycena galericulata]|nr:hypothetical protein B0H11DRAFT_2225654 [Mycena galericulata]
MLARRSPDGGKPAGKRPYGFVATPVKAGQLRAGFPRGRRNGGNLRYFLTPPWKPPPKMLSEDARMTGSGSDRSFKGAEVEEWVFFVFSNILHGPRLAYIQQGG